MKLSYSHLVFTCPKLTIKAQENHVNMSKNNKKMTPEQCQSAWAHSWHLLVSYFSALNIFWFLIYSFLCYLIFSNFVHLPIFSNILPFFALFWKIVCIPFPFRIGPGMSLVIFVTPVFYFDQSLVHLLMFS